MGRHSNSTEQAQTANPALARIRARAEARGPLAVAALGAVSYACAAACGTILALGAYMLLGQSEVRDDQPARITYTYRTATPAPQPLPSP